MRKPEFAYAKTKMLISAFVFGTRIVQLLFFLIQKLEVSNHLARMNVFSHYLTVKLKVAKILTEKQETFVLFLILEYPTSF